MGKNWGFYLVPNRQRDPIKRFCLVKAMAFPVVMYGCENWTIKKAEHQRMMVFSCGVGGDSLESLGLQRDPTSQS